MYYLQSRYYDSDIGRFINADSYSSTGQGILGHSMFTYCGNNPITGFDPDGEFALSVLGTYIAKATIGAIVNTVTSYIGAKVTGQDFGWSDVGKAAFYGAVGSLGTIGTIFASGLSGARTGFDAVKNGASVGEGVIRGISNSIGVACSVSNIAGWRKIHLDTATAALTDLVFGTASSSISSAISTACDARYHRQRTSNKTPDNIGPETGTDSLQHKPIRLKPRVSYTISMN